MTIRVFHRPYVRTETMTWSVVSNDVPSVWKRAEPRNRMREILTSGSVGGLVEQSPALPGLPNFGGGLLDRPDPPRVRKSKLVREQTQWNPPSSLGFVSF